MKPGEIYIADIPESGTHPIIVLSREELNRGLYVVAVICTSAKFSIRSRFANCVPFYAGEFGFQLNCVAQGETVQPVSIRFINPDLVGILDDEKLREVIRAVGYVIEADCEPV